MLDYMVSTIQEIIAQGVVEDNLALTLPPKNSRTKFPILPKFNK